MMKGRPPGRPFSFPLYGGSFGSCMDESTKARAHTLFQQTLLGDAAEHAEIGVMVWNEERRYVAVNTFACRLLGVSREELLGSQVGDEVVREIGVAVAADVVFAKHSRVHSAPRVTADRRVQIASRPRRRAAHPAHGPWG